MILEVLVSCMGQEDMVIVEQSKITSNALVINQSDRNAFQQYTNENQIIRMISTTQRGLSKSRNMAIDNAAGDICLFCDNDEVFYHGYEQIVLAAFERLSDADLILFDFDNLPHSFKREEHQLSFFELFHAISCQIAYRTTSLKKAGVKFHPYMGAGTGNGAQEENKFLIDCYKKSLKIYYVPVKIGKVIENESTWFTGYNEKFFYQRGASTRQMLGFPLAMAYAVYYTVRKYTMYRKEISPFRAFYATVKGCFEDPIGKQARVHNLTRKS